MMLRPRKEFRSESVFGLVYSFIHSVWIRTRALPFSMVAVKRKVTNHSTPKICFILPPVENQYILRVCRVVVTSTGAEGILSPDPEAVKTTADRKNILNQTRGSLIGIANSKIWLQSYSAKSAA